MLDWKFGSKISSGHSTNKKHAADFVPPASPLHPPREKTTIHISPIKPSRRLGLKYITHDLIPNILIHLPPRSVARFRSVCKDWLAVISDPDFVDAHVKAVKQRSPSLLMVPTTSSERHGFPLLMGFYSYRIGEEAKPMHSKKLCGSMNMRDTPVHCDGMILITARAELMMICNPATGEVVRLPCASVGIFNVPRYPCLIPYTSRTGLGFDPRSNKYKAARFFYNTGVYTPVCKFEVLTLGTDVWRQTADDPPCPIAGRTPVHVQGSIYWMLLATKWAPHAFLRFSLADEKFSFVPCPPSAYKPARFVPSETDLCCTCFCEKKRELEVWSLRSVGREDNPSWTRRCTMVIGPDLVLLDYNGSRRRSPKVVLHESTLIMTAESKVYQYDMLTARLEASGIHDIRYYDQRFYQKNVVLHLTNYVESLVRVNQL